MHLNNIGHSIRILNIYVRYINSIIYLYISQFKRACYYNDIFFDKTLNM